MANRIRKNRTQEAEWQTNASVWKAIRYLDSPTNYQECLPGKRRTGPLAESNFVVLDDSSGFDWLGLRDLALIAILAAIIVLLALRN